MTDIPTADAKCKPSRLVEKMQTIAAILEDTRFTYAERCTLARSIAATITP